MSVSREKLYEEVWAEPMLQVAARYKVSSSFLARVCRRLKVPCPPRGYWARKRAGLKMKIPPLNEPDPGGEIEWARGSTGRRAPFPPPSTRMAKRTEKQRPDSNGTGNHALLKGIDEYFKSARELSSGYLRPSKRLMTDVFVTKKSLARAIETANQLYRYLEAEGYKVELGHFSRAQLNHCQGRDRDVSSWDTWTPSRPTVVMIGTMALGLTLFEVSEEAEAQHLNGRWIRLTDVQPTRRRRYGEPALWVSKHEFTTGRLALRAYSPYSDVQWERRWVEVEAGGFPEMFDEIAKSLKREATRLVPLVREAQEKRQREYERQLAEQEAWLKEDAIRRAARAKAEAERARVQAIQDSQRDLLKIIDQWDRANRVKAFLLEIEQMVVGLNIEDGEFIKARLERARELLGEANPLESIREWRTPEER